MRILNAPFPTIDERDPSAILTLRLSAHVEQVVNKWYALVISDTLETIIQEILACEVVIRALKKLPLYANEA